MRIRREGSRLAPAVRSWHVNSARLIDEASARQLSSLPQVAYPGQARPCLVCACQHLDVPGQARQHLDHGWTNVWPRLAKPVSTWTISGPRLASAWTTHALPS